MTGAAALARDRVLAIAAILGVGLAAAMGGYAIGDEESQDLDAVRAAGQRAGHERGAARGAERGYTAGFERSRRDARQRAYRRSFRRACRRAVERAETTILADTACP